MTKSTLEALVGRTASAIEPGARVLHVGCTSCAPLLEVLHERGCPVTIVLEQDAAISDAVLANCERIVRGSVDDAEVRLQLLGDAFDVAVVSDALIHAQDPIRLLKTLARLLAKRGRVVAAVPNIAHATGVLDGLAGADLTGTGEPPARHFFTREMLETLFEACGFAIGRIDRLEVTVDTGAGLPLTRSGLHDVPASLGAPADARASHFVLVAFPEQVSPLTGFRDKVRTLVRRCELAEQKLRHLATVSDPEADAIVVKEPVVGREDDSIKLRLMIDGLYAQLRELRSEAVERQATLAELENMMGSVAAVRDELDQFRRLGADAAAIERAMEGLREQLRVAERQMHVMRESFSWRLTAPVRALVRGLGGTTSDAILGPKR